MGAVAVGGIGRGVSAGGLFHGSEKPGGGRRRVTAEDRPRPQKWQFRREVAVSRSIGERDSSVRRALRINTLAFCWPQRADTR
jgi:hypothetical protein